MTIIKMNSNKKNLLSKNYFLTNVYLKLELHIFAWMTKENKHFNDILTALLCS